MITTINEYINNKRNAKYYVKNLLTEIAYIIGKKPDFVWEDYNDKLSIRNIEVKYSTKIDKIFKKYENIFIKNGIWMKWKNSTSEDVKIGDDLTSFHRTGRLLSTYYMSIKDIYLKRIKPTKYVYHTTKKENKEEILKNGLIPSLNKNFLDSDINLSHPEAIFATMSNIESVWQFDPKKKDIWEIDTTKIDNKWYQDLNMPGREGLIVTYETISPDSIELRNDHYFFLQTQK